jgi:Acetoacetate decarboxylase (ADC)
MKLSRLLVPALLVTLAGAAPAGATTLANTCPHVGSTAPNPSCITEPIPGEGWVVAAMRAPARRSLSLYRSLIPDFYAMPRRPMVAFTGSRLNVGSPTVGTADPGQGYMESTVEIRVRRGDEEGWFPLATPVNDSSQYQAGRWVGIPKWMADLSMTPDHAAGTWTAAATAPGNATAVFERITWAPAKPARLSYADA